MGIKFKGSSELQATLRRLPKQMLDASAVGQHNAAQDVMALSVTRAPFEEGDLEKSAFVSDVRYGGASASVDYGYSGPAYLVRQHEDLSLSHPGLDTRTSNPGRAAQGQAKFLESAQNEMSSQTERTIAAAVDYFLRTGRLPHTRGSIPNKQ